jgi:hypothetical protein
MEADTQSRLALDATAAMGDILTVRKRMSVTDHVTAAGISKSDPDWPIWCTTLTFCREKDKTPVWFWEKLRRNLKCPKSP